MLLIIQVFPVKLILNATNTHTKHIKHIQVITRIREGYRDRDWAAESSTIFIIVRGGGGR